MWIRLKSNKEGNTLLVSLDQVTHIAPRAGGGSTLYFAMETADPTGRQPKQRLLAVRDSIDDIAPQLEFAGLSSVRSRAA
ncbi:hypothetical protein [Kumtagia ephedrae]|jgi:hypothetical protein|uniref:Uncharacterized protein n=1 Tax=Kumtagia ephedrae TaxID=2116701 RepID=A0A2P7S8S1_9HYPH|nr:hypothetical protein [Mesorhizobium ephedrae]PSJ58715.1 hypothetical protein C7I84_14625 [Mesorhizobium ephedrae]